ncbi:hypothetical protein GMORB2_6112 [Geosmithia morbida]|uniref:F-box domain-containing protein n=1 Tax=Geosmithia morbida TaxID=1094350 RepID=A0A9P4YUM1_9HYPO|nr:uncharacterized protein GMORB2_6112 [Geosmithia morbida]KAF4123411.1 hypothetical protein GMORB2_6112 [Geosmithia morbida]
MYAIQEDGADSPVSPGTGTGTGTGRRRRRSSRGDGNDVDGRGSVNRSGSHWATAGERVPGTPPPTALNSPRKLSNGSASSVSTMFSRESARSEMQRSSSSSSKTSFDSFDSGNWKSVDFGGGGPRSPGACSQQYRRGSGPDGIFGGLPDAVLGLVLDHLKSLHLDDDEDGTCATCWMRDVCSISLTSRRWSKPARAALYGDIQLVGADSATLKKRFKLIYGPRIVLLRRTLRADPAIARLVRSIKVPRPEPKTRGLTAKVLEQYEDLVASLIMACPNLETVSGPLTGYDHGFRKMWHALSTRTELRELNWLLEPSAAQKKRQHQQPPPPPYQAAGRPHNLGGAAPASAVEEEPDPGIEPAFLQLHQHLKSLTCLTMHCYPGAGLGSDTLLSRTLSALPSLQRLHLSDLPAGSFSDSTLLSLPALRTLSLTAVPGITSAGLSSFATRPQSQPLRSLSLRHTPLTSLPALARILSKLGSLASFALTQTFPPMMPDDDDDVFSLWMMPYLASPSLRSIHWDITSHRDCANVADDILARSIAAGGFPALRVLRAPNDPDAVFQGLCRPLDRIDLPTDRFCASDMPRPLSPASGPLDTPTFPPAQPLPSPSSFLFGLASPRPTPTTPQFPPAWSDVPAPPACTDLRIARLSAQTRLERARARHRFSVTVTDDDGSVVDRFGVGGFLGTLGSPISYVLLPDPGSADERGGAVHLKDLYTDAGESLADADRRGCCGAWNRREGPVADKKDRERWWHTERGRWTRIEL